MWRTCFSQVRSFFPSQPFGRYKQTSNRLITQTADSISTTDNSSVYYSAITSPIIDETSAPQDALDSTDMNCSSPTTSTPSSRLGAHEMEISHSFRERPTAEKLTQKEPNITWKLLYVPDPTRYMSKRDAEVDIAWTTESITEEELESVQCLIGTCIYAYGKRKRGNRGVDKWRSVLIQEWVCFLYR